MAQDRDSLILTYNGVDGFCAAAMALLQLPKAEVMLSSAAKVGRTFEKLSRQESPPAEVHVCGLGIYCDWEALGPPAARLRERGTRVYWHCGRGYLDNWRERLTGVCTPLFQSSRTNTEALCRHFELGQLIWAGKLLEIAAADPALRPARVSPEAADWRDLIQAATSGYLKYQDEEICPATIRKLAGLGLRPEDREAIERYRKFSDHHIIRGSSEKMKALRRLIARCAVVDEPVILTGESGTGKEYAAWLLHERSPRAGEPFVAVNCAIFAGNPGLANSTLFGHVRGAFTGATGDRQGAFASANSGTLFLDELGLLPVEVQGKLLRILEEGVVVPEGSDRPVAIEVRVIAATNREIPALIREGSFLPDLYHRVNTLRIELPRLREHPEDLPAIAREKLLQLKVQGYPLQPSREDYELLAGYDWPGNVRQFFKLLKRVAYLDLSFREALEEERRQGRLERGGGGEPGREEFLPSAAEEIRDFEEVKQRYLTRAWELTGRNYAAAGRRLGVSVNTLRKYVG